MMDALLRRRAVTYHGLRVAVAEQGNDPKQLGRLLLRDENMGLVVPRQYARGEDRERVAAEGSAKEFGRPRLWESVSAAAAALFGTRRRPS